MTWTNEETEALEWLLNNKSPLSALELVLENRTSTAIIVKIHNNYKKFFNKYYKEYNQKPKIKQYKKEYTKKYYQENKEYFKEYKKKYYQKNKEKIKEYNQKPEIKQQHQEYNQNYYQRPKVKQHMEEYNQKPEIKQHKKEYNQEYKQNQAYKQNLQEILNICDTINESMTAGTAMSIYELIIPKEEGYITKQCLCSIINYSLELEGKTKKTKELAKIARVRPSVIMNKTREYKQIITY